MTVAEVDSPVGAREGNRRWLISGDKRGDDQQYDRGNKHGPVDKIQKVEAQPALQLPALERKCSREQGLEKSRDEIAVHAVALRIDTGNAGWNRSVP